jgi:hypothetical protein
VNFFNYDQKERASLIPANTLVRAVTELQFPDVPESSIHPAVWISKSNPDNKYLKMKFFIKDQEYKGRQIFEYIGVEGSEFFVKMGRKKINDLIRSSLDIDPNDMSPEAASKCVLRDYSELSGLHCYLKITVKKGNSAYPNDSNGCLLASRKMYENRHSNQIKQEGSNDEIPF